MNENTDEPKYYHDDYQYQEYLYKVRFDLNNPFIKEIFKDHPDLYKNLEYIQFIACKELYTLAEWQTDEPLTNLELIQKRLRRKRKSALFYCFWRYSFNFGLRGYLASHMCSAHTFNVFIKGEESKEMLGYVIVSTMNYLKSKNSKVDEF